MPLTITQRMDDGDDIAIIELSGILNLSPTLKQLRDKARELFETNKVKGLIIDVGAVIRTDSAGLAELVVVNTLASRKSRPTRLINVKANLQALLKMTHLDRVLPSCPDLATARAEIRNHNK